MSTVQQNSLSLLMNSPRAGANQLGPRATCMVTGFSQSQRDSVAEPRVRLPRLAGKQPWVEGRHNPNPERVAQSFNPTYTARPIRSRVRSSIEYATLAGLGSRTASTQGCYAPWAFAGQTLRDWRAG